MLRKLIEASFLALLLTGVVLAAESPDGFIVWSDGNHSNRTLKYQELEEGVGPVGSAQTLCARGSFSDIQCVISMDAKYVAFARELSSINCCYDGPGDYHMFGNYDIYICRADGAMPASITKVGHGYWPSWGDDSDGDTKTLYFSYVPGGGRGNEDLRIKKATVNADGSVSAVSEHLNVPQNSGDAHMQVSPNGRYVAFRTDGVYIWDSQTNQTKGSYGGCHPSWGSDSYWLYHATNAINPCVNGTLENAGASVPFPYHCGWSNDMKWVIGRIGNYGNDQNTAHMLEVHSIDVSAPGEAHKWNRSKVFDFVNGTWCDIHVRTGPSLGLTSADGRIALDAGTTLTTTMAGGLTGAVVWSVTGGGALSDKTDAGATFTAGGTEGTSTVTATVGDISKSVDIIVYDPSKIHIRVNAGGSATGEWEAANSYITGFNSSNNYPFDGNPDVAGIENAAPVAIYNTVYHTNEGEHTYSFAVPDGNYGVRMHFYDAAAGRSMEFLIEGVSVLSEYDPPDNVATVKGFNATVSDGNGLQVECLSHGNDVFLAGIEVFVGATTGTAPAGRINPAARDINVKQIANGKYQIVVPSDIGGFRAEIVSAGGAVVHSFAGNGATKCIWNPANASGTYFVNIVADGVLVSRKIAVNK